MWRPGMKRLGEVVGCMGSLMFIGGLVWLRYFLASSRDADVSLLLIVAGLLVAAAGFWLARKNSPGGQGEGQL